MLHHSVIKSIDVQNIQILLIEKRSVLHFFSRIINTVIIYVSNWTY